MQETKRWNRLFRQAADLQHQAIAMRAHQVFVAHGGRDGHDLQDWLAAEREFVELSLGWRLKSSWIESWSEGSDGFQRNGDTRACPVSLNAIDANRLP